MDRHPARHRRLELRARRRVVALHRLRGSHVAVLEGVNLAHEIVVHSHEGGRRPSTASEKAPPPPPPPPLPDAPPPGRGRVPAPRRPAPPRAAADREER